jgi:membrane associated rhomboid family serine protease
MFNNPFANMTLVVKNLLILNVLMFVAQLLYPWINENLALYPFSSPNFQPVQVITHFFMHDSTGFTHIFFNMFGLVFFGSKLEYVWGPKRFLLFYFGAAFSSVILTFIWQWYSFGVMNDVINQFTANPSLDKFDSFFDSYISYDRLTSVGVEHLEAIRMGLSEGDIVGTAPHANEFMMYFADANMNTPAVGASGALFGLLAGYAYLFPNTELMLMFPPIPIKAKYLALGYSLIELYLGFIQNPNDNIGHFAHLGGALFGFLLVYYWNKTNKNSFY